MLTRENRSTRGAGGGKICTIATLPTICLHCLAWNRTLVSAVRSWRLPTLSIAGPSCGEQVCLFVRSFACLFNIRKEEENDEIVKQGEFPFHAVKVYGASRGIAPFILTLALDGKVVSFTPRPSYPRRKSLWRLLNRRFCGHQNRSGLGGEEKHFCPCQKSKPGSSIP